MYNNCSCFLLRIKKTYYNCFNKKKRLKLTTKINPFSKSVMENKSQKRFNYALILDSSILFDLSIH